MFCHPLKKDALLGLSPYLHLLGLISETGTRSESDSQGTFCMYAVVPLRCAWYFLYASSSLEQTSRLFFKSDWSVQTRWRLSWGKVDRYKDTRASLGSEAPPPVWPPGAVSETTGLLTRHTPGCRVSCNKTGKWRRHFYSGYRNQPLKHSIASWLQIMELQHDFCTGTYCWLCCKLLSIPVSTHSWLWWPWVIYFGIGRSFLHNKKTEIEIQRQDFDVKIMFIRKGKLCVVQWTFRLSGKASAQLCPCWRMHCGVHWHSLVPRNYQEDVGRSLFPCAFQ